MEEMVIELNELKLNAIIQCPYCSKGRLYSYSESGLISSSCSICKRLVLWDISRKIAYKARARKMNK